MSRYSRVLELSSFSEEKLNILKSKKVLIVGAGGIGQTVSTYLVTNGVEDLTICDFDNAEISNLNRQILLTEKHLGEPKVEIVKKALQKRNGEAKIKSLYLQRLIKLMSIRQLKGLILWLMRLIIGLQN